MIPEQVAYVKRKHNIKEGTLQFNNYGVKVEETKEVSEFREYMKTVPKGGYTDVDRLIELYKQDEGIISKIGRFLGKLIRKDYSAYVYKPRLK